jgi:hypothetical protein
MNHVILRKLYGSTLLIPGQIVGLSSSEFGLSRMIWAAVVIGKVISNISGYLNTLTVFKRAEITTLQPERWLV